MHHGTFLHSVSCESCVFDWKVLCALYNIKVEFVMSSVQWFNITCNKRKKIFFLYICVCFVCISRTYHASFYTLHITLTLQSCACCFLMQFFFFFYRNSIQTNGAIYFNWNVCKLLCVFLLVLLCSIIVFIFVGFFSPFWYKLAN